MLVNLTLIRSVVRGKERGTRRSVRDKQQGAADHYSTVCVCVCVINRVCLIGLKEHSVSA